MNDNDFIKDDVETLDLGIFGGSAPIKTESTPITEEFLNIEPATPAPAVAPARESVAFQEIMPTAQTPAPAVAPAREPVAFQEIMPTAQTPAPAVAPAREPVAFQEIMPTTPAPAPTVAPAREPVAFQEIKPATPALAPTTAPMSEPAAFNQPQAVETPVTPTFTEVAPTKMSEEAALAKIKDVQESVPNRLNDDVLKMEDTLLTNNLKEQIKETEANPEEEEKKNKRAMTFIITIFVLLGLAIALLPFISSILG